METNTECTHSHFIDLDARVGYGEVTVGIDGDRILDIDDEDPEEVEFPESVTGLGIENDSSGSTVNISMKICVDCRRVL